MNAGFGEGQSQLYYNCAKYSEIIVIIAITTVVLR